METIERGNGIVRLIAAEGMGLRRKGTDAALVQDLCTVADDAPDWEELPMPANQEEAVSKSEYAEEVERLIALRYSHGKEIEVNREKDTKPERFAEYMAYVEECKRQAPASIRERRRQERLMLEQQRMEAERQAEEERLQAEQIEAERIALEAEIAAGMEEAEPDPEDVPLEERETGNRDETDAG